MAEIASNLDRAWELCYLDPLAACQLARGVADEGGAAVAEAWALAALVEVRVGDATAALEALARARSACAPLHGQRRRAEIVPLSSQIGRAHV